MVSYRSATFQDDSTRDAAQIIGRPHTPSSWSRSGSRGAERPGMLQLRAQEEEHQDGQCTDEKDFLAVADLDRSDLSLRHLRARPEPKLGQGQREVPAARSLGVPIRQRRIVGRLCRATRRRPSMKSTSGGRSRSSTDSIRWCHERQAG